MECISHYFRVFSAGIYREIFACNRFAVQNSVFHNSREYRFKKKNHACHAYRPVSVNGVVPVRLRNVSRELIYSRKSAGVRISFKKPVIQRLAPIANSATVQNRSCAMNDIICPCDSLPVVFRLYDEGNDEEEGGTGRVRIRRVSRNN